MAIIYIAPTGNDTTGDGSVGNPYATVGKAFAECSVDDTISAAAGDYTISTRITWNKSGVNLIGAGKSTTTIICHVADNSSIVIYDDDTHEFSGFTFDGDAYTGLGAIATSLTNGFIIHDCDFKDFSEYGVSFGNSTPPTNYCTGNQIYNCTFTDCSKYDVEIGSPGSIGIFGQDGFICHDISITQPTRDSGETSAGFGIKTNYTKGLQLYNCIVSIPENDDNSVWAFAVEMWNTSDNCVIYDNTFNGPVDFAGDYTTDVEIYGNTIGHDSLQAVARVGILLECEGDIMQNVVIRNNTFKCLQNSISFYTLSVSSFDNITIRNNVFHTIGITENTYWGEVIGTLGNAGFSMSKINIYNNVFDSNRDTNTLTGIVIPSSGTVENYNVINNIFVSFGNAYIISDSEDTGTIDKVNLKNNCLYGNGSYDYPSWGGVIPTNLIQSGNIYNDPILDENYIIGRYSPCIDSGIYVGIAFNGSAPDIGYFETNYYTQVINTSKFSIVLMNQITGQNHAFEIDSLNYMCTTMLGGTGGHTYIVPALKEICSLLGYSTTGNFTIELLNTICTGGGGTGGHTYEYEAWYEIQQGSVLNYNPATDADVALWLKSRVGTQMVATVGNNVDIATPVINMVSNSSINLPSAGHIMTTESFAIEMKLNVTTGSVLLRQGGGYATAAPGYSVLLSDIQLSSNVSVIYNGSSNLNLLNQGWVHVFIVFNRAGYLDAYRNGVRVLHVDISAKAAESISNAAAYLAIGAGTNYFVGQLAYARFYKFTSGVPADIATYILSNYNNRVVDANLLNDLTQNYVPVFTATAIRFVDFKSDSINAATVPNASKAYSIHGSQHILNYGYSKYRTLIDTIPFPLDVIVPLLMDGSHHTNPPPTYYDQYTQEYIGDYVADVSHPGLTGYKLHFLDAFFDRSDTTIWSDAARSSFDYDAGNTKDFHAQVLNQRTLQSWLNDGYKGRLFVKYLSSKYTGEYFGSIEDTDRVKLLEIILYNTNKTGVDHKKVLEYTGDIFAAVKDENNAIIYDANNQVQLGYLQTTKPMFTLKIDDGVEYQGSDTWRDVLLGVDAQPSIYLLSGLIGTTGFITWEKAHELEARGWEIADHGLDDSDLSELTHAEIETAITTSKATLISNGFSPKNFGPHKYGQASLYVRKIAMQNYRSTHAGYTIVSPEGANPKKIIIDNLTAMRGDISGDFMLNTPEGRAAIKAQLDICAAENRWAILFQHAGDPVHTGEIVTYAKSIGIEMMTLDEALSTCKYLP